MEEIGPTSITSSAQSSAGYQVLLMDKPAPLVSIHSQNSCVIVLDVFESGDLCGKTLAENLVIFASDVDADLYGFDQNRLLEIVFAFESYNVCKKLAN